MTRGTVYLAGPIAHTKAGAAFEWRLQATIWLQDLNFQVLNPLRGKDKLLNTAIGGDMKQYESLGAFYKPAAIMQRDHSDVCRADFLLVNLLGAQPSYGTTMELAWAYHMRKPIIVAIEPRGNTHDLHPMISQCLTFRAPALDDAVGMLTLVAG